MTRAWAPVLTEVLISIGAVAVPFLWGLRLALDLNINTVGILLLMGCLGYLAWRRAKAGTLPTIFAIPLLLFLISAAVGLFTTHDFSQTAAHVVAIVTAVGLFWVLAHPVEHHAPQVVLYVLASLSVILACYTLIPLILSLSWRRVNENSAGGLLAMTLPLQIALWMRMRARTGWSRLVGVLLGGLGIVVTLGALLFSGSSGALLSGLPVLGLWTLWHLSRRSQRWQRRAQWIVGATLGIVFVFVALGVSADLPGSEMLQIDLEERLQILPAAVRLAYDYIFTGTGLGTFEMQFSAYTLLIHVGHIQHAHNLFMDILIEQGGLGLCAYLWLTGMTFLWGIRQLRTAPRNVGWVIEAGLAMQAVILVHGLVDDILYLNRGFLLIPMGIIVGAAQQRGGEFHPFKSIRRRRRWRGMMEIAFSGLLFTLVVWWPVLCSSWWANLGAVVQSQVELGRYDQTHFSVLTLDQIRREEDETLALTYFERALTLYPQNATARRRRAQIALARGQYEEAKQDMQSAWDAGHRDTTTRLLLGDSLVATGETTRAAQVIQGLPWAESRLRLQAWSRYWLRGEFQHAHHAWEVIQLLNPSDPDPANWLERIETQMVEQE